MNLLGAAELERQLQRLGDAGEKAARSGLTRLAFETRDSLRRETLAALAWSGPQTSRFMSNGLVLRYSVEGSVFAAMIYPLPRAAAFFARHVSRYTNRPGAGEDMEMRGQIAIPIAATVRRGSTGRVPARLRPAALLERNAKGRSRGFINAARTALMYRLASGEVTPAYALRPQTTQPGRLDFPAWARRAVAVRGPVLMREAIEKALRAALGSS